MANLGIDICAKNKEAFGQTPPIYKKEFHLEPM